jgi:cytoskeletal protein RodZ
MILLQLTRVWSFADFMTGFGAEFKKARESRGLSLDKIAAETRISTRFLKAIEEEEFQVLPGGIFNRGFIRSYAQHLGLDPEQAISDYERLTSAVQPPADLLIDIEPVTARKSERDLYPIAIVVLAVLIAIFYLVNRNSQTESVTEGPGNAEPAAATPPSEPAAPAPATSPVTPPAELPKPSSGPPVPAAVRRPSGTPAPLVLELEANSETWISLKADSNPPEELIMMPGNTRRYEADMSMALIIGNAAGVVMKVNGRELGMLGREGQTKRFLITPENAGKIGA